MKLLSAFSVAAFLFQACQAASDLDPHNFKPPFAAVDSSGNRIVDKDWVASGTTVVNNNFIRLTPDRQSKKGALWNSRPLNMTTFSNVLSFRISGQGKNFFGDGIAMWIVQQNRHSEGELHGLNEKFVGVGIIFDTFKNTENSAVHRDVTVLVNDGDKTYDLMTRDVQGCNANFRYHAGRADFAVTDLSRAKIIVDGSRVEVMIDAHNDGEFVSCVKIQDIGLKSDWAKTAHLGLTATTGQLADNHDIISLRTYTDAEHLFLDSVIAEEAQQKSFQLDTQQPLEVQLKSLEDAITALLKSHETMDHHVEHQFASVSDHIKNLIGKLEKREEKSETRIDDLEAVIKKTVDGSLDRRLSALELQMKGSVDRKMNNIESALDRKLERMEGKQSELITSTTAGGASWRLPFLFLLVLIIGAGIGLYMFYRNLLKRHLL